VPTGSAIGQAARVLLEPDPPAKEQDAATQTASPSSEERDRIVDRAVAGLQAAKARTEALELNRAGRYDDARRVLEALLQRDPSDEDARLQLGELHLAQGRHRHAAEIFKAVLEQDPRHAQAHEYLARAYRKLGEPEKAIAVLEQAMAVEGARNGAAGLDRLRDTLDQYEDAVAEYSPGHREEWNSNLRRLTYDKSAEGYPSWRP
jgi:tetratricopeptide (TPR) repeat protein